MICSSVHPISDKVLRYLSPFCHLSNIVWWPPTMVVLASFLQHLPGLVVHSLPFGSSMFGTVGEVLFDDGNLQLTRRRSSSCPTVWSFARIWLSDERVNLLSLIQVLQEKLLVRVILELLNQLFDCFSAIRVLLLDCRTRIVWDSTVFMLLRWIGYFRPELNLWVWSPFWVHIGGGWVPSCSWHFGGHWEGLLASKLS